MLEPMKSKSTRLLASSFMLVAIACAASSETPSAQTTHSAVGDTTFARLVEALSEPGGYFDTDNLISNETSYLHVVGKLPALGVRGGAYIGVGPDQNFSYIAHVRPSVAFIIDIRRDNMLQHLLFKALFHLSPTRVEYLSYLLARPPPEDGAAWMGRSIDDLVEHVDGIGADFAVIERLRTDIRATIDEFGLPLSEEDHATIRQIHDAFIEDGLALQFNSFGRRPQPYYPTFRQLLLETDLAGNRGNFLATGEAYGIVRNLQKKNLIIPVVGDLAGDHALRAIGRYVEEAGDRVSFFYTSNVEFYLMRNGTFDRFADNVATLPTDERSVIARSYFGGMYRTRHPQAVRGHYSTQLLQPIRALVDEHSSGGIRSYQDLVTKHSLELQGR